MANDLVTLDDINAMKAYVREQEIAIRKGQAISRGDFAEWARLNAVWLLDKLEQAWKWIRNFLGLDL
jgi:hypothetical protein